jgi:hypothetical protein
VPLVGAKFKCFNFKIFVDAHRLPPFWLAALT